MKKFFLLVIVSMILLLFWCDNNISNIDKQNDLEWYIMWIEDIYCDYAHIISDFSNAPSTDWYKSYMVNWNDVPSQRAISKKLLNDIDIMNTDSKIKTIKKDNYSKDFQETIRLIELLSKFLTDFLQKNSNLNNFNEFKEFMVIFQSANKSLKSIEPSLNKEYGILVYNDKTTYSGFTTSFLELERICSLTFIK